MSALSQQLLLASIHLFAFSLSFPMFLTLGSDTKDLQNFLKEASKAVKASVAINNGLFSSTFIIWVACLHQHVISTTFYFSIRKSPVIYILVYNYGVHIIRMNIMKALSYIEYNSIQNVIVSKK